MGEMLLIKDNQKYFEAKPFKLSHMSTMAHLWVVSQNAEEYVLFKLKGAKMSW